LEANKAESGVKGEDVVVEGGLVEMDNGRLEERVLYGWNLVSLGVVGDLRVMGFVGWSSERGDEELSWEGLGVGGLVEE